jgi:hypothetical protein
LAVGREDDLELKTKTVEKSLVPGYNIPRSRPFDQRLGQWATLIVEFLEFVINDGKIVEDKEKFGYLSLTFQ